jgi:methylenetetrahydrofolate dehydrogenase (NADP+) / methenyltetrahydrofolate cyclohydrolase
MPATLIDGAALAATMKTNVAQRVQDLSGHGHGVHLTAILIGSSPAAELYAKRQAETCQAVGIGYRLLTLPADADAKTVIATIDQLNQDASVTGIMLHLPLPKHLNATEVQNRIAPIKDVEGVGATNLGYILTGQPLLVPCTALAAFELVKSTGVPIRGAEAVVVGASAIAGKPVALLLSEERATVTICRSASSNLAEHCRRAKILIAAVGKPNMITADHVAEGAVVVDVGINRITLPDGTKKTVGDVDFDAVKNKAGYLTPVPGGVGPMTVAILLNNTIRSAELLAGKP